jgi:hypothetical protein
MNTIYGLPVMYLAIPSIIHIIIYLKEAQVRTVIEIMIYHNPA